MKFGSITVLVQAIALVWTQAALAQDEGFVVRKTGPAGTVLIVRGVETRVLDTGDPIYLGDRIYTLTGGRVALSHGGCQVEVDANSSFVVDDQFCASAPVTLAPSATGEVRLSDGPEGSLLVLRDEQTFSLFQGDVLFDGDKVFTRSNGAAVLEAHGCDVQLNSATAITVDESVCRRRPVLLAANDRIGDVRIGVPFGGPADRMRVSASPTLLAGLGIGAGVGAAAAGGGGGGDDSAADPLSGDDASGAPVTDGSGADDQAADDGATNEDANDQSADGSGTNQGSSDQSADGGGTNEGSSDQSTDNGATDNGSSNPASGEEGNGDEEASEPTPSEPVSP